MLDLSEKKVRLNMIMGVVYKGLSMIISFLYVPVVLLYLGEVKYGIWTTILNILSWITHFDIGIGNGLRNKLSESLMENQDKNRTKCLVSSAYIMLTGVVLLVIIVGCTAACFVDWNGLLGVGQFDENLRLIMQISIICVGVNFVLSLCKSIYYSLLENSTVGLMGVVQQGLMLLGVLVLKKFKSPSILIVALLYGLTDFTVSIFYSLLLFKRNKSFIPSFRYYSKTEARETTSLGIMFFIAQMASLVLFSTDNLIISHFIGPAEVTCYSIVNKLFTVGTAMFTMLVVPYWSRTTAAKACGDYKMIQRSIYTMYKLLGLGVLGSFTLMILFKPIAKIWLRQELDYPAGIIALMAIYAIVYMWNTIYSQITNGLSLMKVLVPIAIIQGVVNIPLSIFFMLWCNMGVNGVLLGTILSMMISAVVIPVYVHKELRSHIAYKR